MRTGTNESRNGMVVAAAAGVVVPPVFVIVVGAQGLQHADYSHIALPISALAAWPGGWLQSLNFVVLGSAMVAFAAGLHHGVVSDRNSVTGPALLGLSGIGLLLAATFPWRRLADGFLVPAGHLVGAALTFTGVATGLTVISRRMAADPRWRSVAAFTLGSGIAVGVLFLVTMLFARPEDGPLHAQLGLLQRSILLAWFPCMIILSLQLWRIVRTPAPAHEESRRMRGP